jgi:hypothetical protein
MKKLAELIGVGASCVGTLWVEYEIASRLGSGFIFFAAASGLIVLGLALHRAPEGDERIDGFHVRRSTRRSSVARQIRFSQPARARQ